MTTILEQTRFYLCFLKIKKKKLSDPGTEHFRYNSLLFDPRSVYEFMSLFRTGILHRLLHQLLYLDKQCKAYFE